MAMLRSVLGEDAHFGPACASGPLGGDAQVGAQLCLGDIGGVIFFTDPLTAHPHLADVLALQRLVNVKNVLNATNTASATAMMHVLGKALDGRADLIPSFFKDMQVYRDEAGEARDLDELDKAGEAAASAMNQRPIGGIISDSAL